MPPLRTDDGPRKLRAVWLGPKGGTLPFEWTYVQWCITLIATPFGAVIVAGLAHLLGAPPWVQLLAVLYGGVLGVYLAVKAMRNVTFDEPLRHKTATVRAEFSRRLRRPTEQPLVWEWSTPVISELTPQAARLLTPPKGTPDGRHRPPRPRRALLAP